MRSLQILLFFIAKGSRGDEEEEEEEEEEEDEDEDEDEEEEEEEGEMSLNRTLPASKSAPFCAHQ